MSEIDVLRRARELIASGWCQNQLSDGNRLCMVAAVRKAAGDPLHIHWCGGDAERAIEILDSYLPAGVEIANPDYSNPLTRVPAFNDSKQTTHDDVLAVFDKAIANEGGVV